MSCIDVITLLRNRYYQNYLALCPNHGAMFQHANGSRKLQQGLFVGMADQRLEILLAQESVTIYFTKTHIADMRQIIEVDCTGAGAAIASTMGLNRPPK